MNIFCFRDQRLCSVNGGVHENRGVLKERFHCDYSFVVVFFQNSAPMELNSSSTCMITSTSVALDDTREEMREERRVSD